MPALIFDLDGTLVDTVAARVFSWQRALTVAYRVYRDPQELHVSLDELSVLP